MLESLSSLMLIAQATAPVASDSSMTVDLLRNLMGGLIFAALGIVILAVAWLIICRVTPFSVRKEIEEDQNTALAIVTGAVIIGISLIIAAAVG
ncbi:MAG: DUF350 domain-containing protein [Pirellulales bacterium]|nr:DUF350 domain-containing protein [Pirellulales bacterium]